MQSQDRQSIKRPAFLAESTLGRLTKWLRLAGFDTAADPAIPDARRLLWRSREEHRIVLTRTRRVFETIGSRRSIFISCDDVEDQLREVMRALKIRLGDLHTLTLCSRCNHRLEKAVKDDLPGRVPDHIWHHHETFLRCPRCGRIYWAGSHAVAMRRFMRTWFEDRE